MDDSRASKFRRLPRHVESRFMIGKVPLWDFILKFLPKALVVAVLVILYFTPVTLFIGAFIEICLFALYYEFHNRENGAELFRDWLKYQRTGDIHYERSGQNVPASERCIRNQTKNRNSGNAKTTD